MTRKKIAVLSSIGAGIGVVSYAAFTISPVVGAAAPVILAFAACPAMCAAVGGAMWIRRRMAKKKASSTAMAVEENSKEHTGSCCGDKQSSMEGAEKKYEVMMAAQETGMFENKNEVDDAPVISEPQPQLQQQRKKKTPQNK